MHEKFANDGGGWRIRGRDDRPEVKRVQMAVLRLFDICMAMSRKCYVTVDQKPVLQTDTCE